MVARFNYILIVNSLGKKEKCVCVVEEATTEDDSNEMNRVNESEWIKKKNPSEMQNVGLKVALYFGMFYVPLKFLLIMSRNQQQ